MSNKYVLTEYRVFDNSHPELLTEAEKLEMANGSVMYLTGVMQRADAENGNGRVYPMEILEREVENYKKLVKEHRSYGELDHPDSPIVELQKASHFVTHIEMKGKEVIGKIKLMDTDTGRNAQGIVRSGGMLSISSRGLGSTTQKNGKTYVQDDYQLVCFDLVSEPSTAGAYMLKEGKVPSIDNKGDRINRALNNVLRSWNK